MPYALTRRSAIAVIDPARLMRRASTVAARTGQQAPEDADTAVAVLMTTADHDVVTEPGRFGLMITATATVVHADPAPTAPESWLTEPPAPASGPALLHIIDSDHLDPDELDDAWDVDSTPRDLAPQ